MFVPSLLSPPGVGVILGKWWSGGAIRPYPEILPLQFFFFFLRGSEYCVKEGWFGEGAISFPFFPLNYWGEGEIAGMKVYAAAEEEGVCFGDLSVARSKLVVLLWRSALLTRSFHGEGNAEFIMQSPSCRKQFEKKTKNKPNVLCFPIYCSFLTGM